VELECSGDHWTASGKYWQEFCRNEGALADRKKFRPIGAPLVTLRTFFLQVSMSVS